MDILIVGGTRFQGRHLVRELLERGHDVTVFHRGSHAIEANDHLTDLVGDRNLRADLARLSDRKFDACIDTCAYFPAQVDLLASAVETRHYSLVSSVYAYADADRLLNESSPLDRSPVEPPDLLTPRTYGALKGLCEEAAICHFGSESLIFRPSIIIGPGDHTERMSFWARMIARHHKRLAIIRSDRPLQLLDVRDLAHFIVQCVEAQRSGSVNICGENTDICTVLETLERLDGHACAKRSIPIEDLPHIGLADLPYLDSGRLGRYDNCLSRRWGFSGRSLESSLRDILLHDSKHDFVIRAFQKEEAAALGLFS